jgi:hypothetical protein
VSMGLSRAMSKRAGGGRFPRRTRVTIAELPTPAGRCVIQRHGAGASSVGPRPTRRGLAVAEQADEIIAMDGVGPGPPRRSRPTARQRSGRHAREDGQAAGVAPGTRTKSVRHVAQADVSSPPAAWRPQLGASHDNAGTSRTVAVLHRE